MSKLLPGSMPIFFICAMIGSSVMCGGLHLEQLGGVGEVRPAGMVSTWIFGGVFMSMLGSILTSTGWGVLPHRDSGVIL